MMLSKSKDLVVYLENTLMLQISSLILVDHEADRPENYRFHCCTNSLKKNYVYTYQADLSDT